MTQNTLQLLVNIKRESKTVRGPTIYVNESQNKSLALVF